MRQARCVETDEDRQRRPSDPSQPRCGRAVRSLEDPQKRKFRGRIACVRLAGISKPDAQRRAPSAGPTSQKKESLARGYLARLIKSAITYFPAEQYHWRQWLNFCVRDGNRCDPLSMVTDKSSAALSGSRGESACVLMNRTKHETGRLRTGRPTSNARRIRTRKPVDATKSLTVSTT